MPVAAQLCPCGSVSPKKVPKTFEQCCGCYINAFDTTPAPDALSLMRSRYTAYVLDNEAYLLATWASEHRPASVSSDEKLKWLDLTVKKYQRYDENSSTVEFVARYRQDGKGGRLHETSRFVRRAGRWYYLDGRERDPL
ncbi:SEC-C motif-containing protein [Jezberella montanilacus]|uniref:SEC-C motif-containing protein n=2 Tax=Jezberella montanilacus TaxID=323426 RepID=A0A2T0XC20_9BURK|nr:SEC-C motif-containing protein [Jezberella montanilacus]